MDTERNKWLGAVSRVVLKLGTGVLTDARKQPDPAQMEQLVAQVAGQRAKGRQVVVVTSGAVGAGMGVLGYERRPAALAEMQACAAVGQSRLMAVYEGLFGTHGIHVAQVLLTHDDLEHHERHLNARNTLVTLLQRGVVPIINENDAISSTELKFGDNDKLSALVACLLPADLLVILTTVDGVLENFGTPSERVLPLITQVDAAVEEMAGGTTSATAVGGMATKIQAAKIVGRSGIPLVIASGRRADVLESIFKEDGAGTLFVPKAGRLKGRKRWIAFFHHPKATLVVDAGARVAVRDGGRSLLKPGVVRVEGEFQAGDVVRVCDEDGLEFARGMAGVSSTGLAAAGMEVIHRDDLVVL